MINPGSFIQLRARQKDRLVYYARCQVVRIDSKFVTVEYVSKVAQKDGDWIPVRKTDSMPMKAVIKMRELL